MTSHVEDTNQFVPFESQKVSTSEGSSSSSKIDFNKLYSLDKVIGEGSSSTVYKANFGYKQAVAVKIIDRVDEKTERKALHEVSILRELTNVSNVVQFNDLYVEEDKMYVVQKLAHGGDVLDRLLERGTYDERDACNLMYVLLKTIRKLHVDYNLVHRDIKPDNLLLGLPNDDTSLQICDFGCAEYLPKSGRFSLSHTRRGTPTYMAPEVISSESYGKEIDMWSIGCTLFVLLGGYQAFEGETDAETYDNIMKCNYSFDDPVWDSVSDEAKELITHLLIVDPKQRWTVTHALQCDWFKSYNLTSSKTTIKRSPDDVRGFRARFRKNESIQGLIDIFESGRFETTTNDNAVKTTHYIYDGWKSKKSILQNTGNIILETFSNHSSSERMRPKSKSEEVKDKIVVDTSLHRKNRASFYASKLNNWISNEPTTNDNHVRKSYSSYDGRKSNNDKLEDTSNNTFETSNDNSSSETIFSTYNSKSKSGEVQDTGAINTSLHLNNTASFYASKLNNWISAKSSNF